MHPLRIGPQLWMAGAVLIFLVAIAAGAVGPDWLTPLLIAPAGLLIVRGAWPLATNREYARTFTRQQMFGVNLPGFGRLWGAVGVLVGAGWFVGGVGGFLQGVL